MKSVALNFGPLTITWYSIFILIGAILASAIVIKEARKYNIPTSFVTNLIFWCVVFGLIGARVYYVLFNLDYYVSSPIDIVKIWNGGLAIHGGIIAGLITLIVYCKKYGVNILKMTDIAVPGLILAQAIGRWGNFFNGEAHGGVVSKAFLEGLHLPDFIIKGMYINGHYYHPTFLYESILCLIGFFVLIGVRSLRKTKLGNTTALYLIWYGIVRFLIEALRTDSLMIGSLKVAQLISVIMIIIGIIMFIITKIKCKNYDEVKAKENEIMC
ncbi:MAG: prolipoprotein diacylglyceryl transferase [Bacilli bacterium]|nr:prolipoprotein diacylglyceryl transferase [Bacilli bacterium]